MKQIGTFFAALFLFTLQRPVFAQQMNPRIPSKRGGPFFEEPMEPFALVFMKTFTENDFLYIDFGFNKVVEPESVINAEIYVDDDKIEKEDISFSRSGRNFRIKTDFLDEDFSISLEGIHSWTNLELPLIELEEVSPNAVYRYNKELDIWQEFSL